MTDVTLSAINLAKQFSGNCSVGCCGRDLSWCLMTLTDWSHKAVANEGEHFRN